MKNVKSVKIDEKKRKLLAVLPLFIFAFSTLVFWALDGGKPAVAADLKSKNNGLNPMLPDAHLPEGAIDKMSYYNNAQKDSAKLNELTQNDPYYKNGIAEDSLGGQEGGIAAFSPSSSFRQSGPDTRGGYSDANEAKVYSKLSQLNTAMNESAAPPARRSDAYQRPAASPVNSKDVDRLEQMMNGMNENKSEDPEMAQLNGMLERILDIQHPDRVQEKLKQNSIANRGQVFPVYTSQNTNPISLLNAQKDARAFKDTQQRAKVESNGFFSADDLLVSNETPNVINAVSHETTTLVDGAILKLRLLNDIYINGIKIPSGTFIFGTASLAGERLGININNISYQNFYFPVKLSVYDVNGLDGIYVPGAITRDVAKQSTQQAVSGIGLTTLDPSIGMQAAGAGIEAVKSLVGKKVKLIRVTVKAGYRVMLLDDKEKESN